MLVSVELTDPDNTEDQNVFPPTLTVMELFEQYLDIFSPPTRKFLKTLLAFADNPKEVAMLKRLLEPSHIDEFNAFIQESNCAEVLSAFPSAIPPIEYLLNVVPCIGPRYYSIASNPELHPSSIHIIVVGYQWDTPRGRLSRERGRLLASVRAHSVLVLRVAWLLTCCCGFLFVQC